MEVLLSLGEEKQTFLKAIVTVVTGIALTLAETLDYILTPVLRVPSACCSAWPEM